MYRLETLRSRHTERLALALAGLLVAQAVAPTAALALTTGPAQPEFGSFEPAGTTQMVDLFTGDFTYNIPLFELPGPDGGYPFNLAYHSGVTADQEASWVGLGWSLNPGAVNRTMRGIPDDFSGEEVEVLNYAEEDVTNTFRTGVRAELLGINLDKAERADSAKLSASVSLNLSAGIAYTFNNYRGVSAGLDFGVGLGLPVGGGGLKVSPGLNFSTNSATGASASGSVSTSFAALKGNGSLGVGAGVASRTGLTHLNLNAGYGQRLKRRDGRSGKNLNARQSTGAQFVPSLVDYTPASARAFRGEGFTGDLAIGGAVGIATVTPNLGYSYARRALVKNGDWVGAPAYGTFHLRSRAELPANALLDFNRANDGVIDLKTTNLAVPLGTPDVYALTGQGTGGLYLPHRQGVGIVSDAPTQSVTNGESVGIEVGIPNEFGATGGVNSYREYSTVWASDGAEFALKPANPLQFSADRTGGREPAFLKSGAEITAEAPGESRYEVLGRDRPLRLERLSGGQFPGIPQGTGFVSEESGPAGDEKLQLSGGRLARVREGRTPRGEAILPVRGADLVGAGARGVASPLFQVDVRDGVGAPAIGGRQGALTTVTPQPTEQFAGILSTTAAGIRYNYTLPVRNTIQYEASFAVDPRADGFRAFGPRGNQVVAIPTDESQRRPGDPLSVIDRLDADKSATIQRFVKTPAYAHSFLLTSVLGTDYIDVNHNGVDDADQGYFVKFGYTRTADARRPYRWKAPYEGAAYTPGIEGYRRDDVASFTAGEREAYYLSQAETRSHVAYFYASARADGAGVPDLLHNGLLAGAADADPADASPGNRAYRLDRIALFAKTELAAAKREGREAVPIQTVHLEYAERADALALGVPNSTVDGGGKLTLERVYTTYKTNDRGALSPYEFTYAGQPGTDLEDLNRYNPNVYDRWGGVKPTTYDDDNGLAARTTQRQYGFAASGGGDPYVPQTAAQLPPGLRGEPLRDALDDAAALWNLTAVRLPSGAQIAVDYERDDYAYVQDRVALQMTPITGAGAATTSGARAAVETDPVAADDPSLKIFFAPEVDGDAADVQAGPDGRAYEAYARHLHGARFTTRTGSGRDGETLLADGAQVGFRIRPRIVPRGGSATTVTVEGYAEVAAVGAEGGRPYLRLRPVTLGRGRGEPYHPFAGAAWQYLRGAAPHLLTVEKLAGDPDDVLAATKGMFAAISDFGSLFADFFAHNANQGIAREFELAGSYLRLSTPDLSKVGGGVRVRAIVLDDHWDVDRDAPAPADGPAGSRVTYGQVYDYTRAGDRGDGTRVSSGVAANEPAVGYEECALRYVRTFDRSTLWRDANVGQTEFPLQEGLLPGASVGYGEVTVRSLASAIKADPALAADLGWSGSMASFAAERDYNTTGETVHRFYTAHDYPVLMEETQLLAKRPGLPNLPFGQFRYRNDSYAGTQGYAITLNDMHGKPAEVAHYGHDRRGRRAALVNRTTYTYLDEDYVRLEAGTPIASKRLVNDVTVVRPDDDDGAAFAPARLGVTSQLLVDMRESGSFAVAGEVDLNNYWLALFPLIIPIPSGSYGVGKVRTAVTSKVIRRQGILAAVEVFDGQSTQVTRNEGFDPLTGRPVYTSVSNSFDDDVYALATPAYTRFDGMGPAYRNLGAVVELRGADVAVDATCAQVRVRKTTDNAAALAVLRPGDELAVRRGADVFGPDAFLALAPRLVVSRVGADAVWFEHPRLTWPAEAVSGESEDAVELVVLRSGARNQLTAEAGAAQSLASFAAGGGDAAYDSLLSASASTFRDSWTRGLRDCEVALAKEERTFRVSYRLPSAEAALATYVLNRGACDDEDWRSFSPSYRFNITTELPTGENRQLAGGSAETSGATSTSFVTLEIPPGFEPEIRLGYQLTVDDSAPRPGCTPYLAGDGGRITGTGERVRWEPDLFEFRTDGPFFLEVEEVTPVCPDLGGGAPVVCGQEAVIQFIAAAGELDVDCAYDVTLYLLDGTRRVAERSWRLDNANPQLVNLSVAYDCDDCGGVTAGLRIVGDGPCGGAEADLEWDGEPATPTGGRDFPARLVSTTCGSTGPAPDPYRTSRLAYSTGQKGVFRPHQSYVYVADRATDGVDGELTGRDLRRDGTFAMPTWLDYDQPFRSLVSGLGGWRLASEVTRYGANGEPTEQRDAIGVYAASVYGYGDFLPVGVAANARESEIAVADFEQVDRDGDCLAATNFSLANDADAPVEYTETYNVVAPVGAGAGAVVLDRTADHGAGIPTYATLHLRDRDGNAYLRDWRVGGLEPVDRGDVAGLPAGLAPQATTFTRLRGEPSSAACEPLPAAAGGYYGEVTLHYTRAPSASSTAGVAQVSGLEAHTGTHSLRVTGPWRAEQERLRLRAGAAYVLSGWVRDAADAAAAEPLARYVDLPAGARVTRSRFAAVAVEGWRRFEVEFAATGAPLALALDAPHGRAYYDDVRVHPVDASFQSYVYALDDYRLLATLDENNYATVYRYDAQGVLTGTLKETERGLKTIQETRAHTRVTAQQ